MPDKQRTFGQYETPADVADLLLSFCLRSPGARLLDPACGDGAILERAGRMQHWLDPGHAPTNTLWGIEFDPEAAVQALLRLPQAHIIRGNFFELEAKDYQSFDAVVGNPPYTRAEWFGRLVAPQAPSEQMSMFEVDESAGQGDGRAILRHDIREDVLNRRAGLHAHFFVHGTQFLREGGRFGFVVPNSWLDVAYGERLKQYLLEHYRILALIESNVERWFDQARINTCLVILEKCTDANARALNRVRLVRLFRPLSELIPYPIDDRQRLSHLERLTMRLLPGYDYRGEDLAVRVLTQRELTPADKWGVALRSPGVYWRHAQDPTLWYLGTWATVRRGLTTGGQHLLLSG